METTRLSSKGQVIIPKEVRAAHQWETGLEFDVIDTEEGLLLKPRTHFAKTELDEVAGCLAVPGKPKTHEELESVIKTHIRKEWRDHD